MALKARIKDMNDRFVDKIKDLQNPAVYKINKVKEMQRIYNETKQKDYSIFLDLDGTVAAYQSLKCEVKYSNFVLIFKSLQQN